MNRLAIFKKTRKEQVYDKLYKLITSSGLAPGERLSPLVELAKRFDTSVFTVQSAMARLEKEGYITKRPGAGTFIASKHPTLTMKDMVGLCIGVQGEHLWGDLNALIAAKVFDSGRVPVFLKAAGDDENKIIERMCHTDAPLFIVNGRWLPVGLFQHKLFQRKTIIGINEWPSSQSRTGLYQVLTDWQTGGRKVAEHLAALGHRRVLILGQPIELETLTDESSPLAKPGRAFAQTLESLGGRCEMMASDCSADPEIRVNVEEFVARLQRPDGPTAVFGLRDVEAWVAQRTIRERLPEIEHRLAIVGYNDTPWSQAAHPPITTVNLNLPEITREVGRILEALTKGEEPTPDKVYVEPQLIVRETSRPAAG